MGNANGWCPNIDRMEVAPSLDIKEVRVESIGSYAARNAGTETNAVTATFRNNSNTDMDGVAVSWALNGGEKHSESISLKAGEAKSHTFSELPVTPGEGNHVLQVNVAPGNGVLGDMLRRVSMFFRMRMKVQ